MSLREIEDLQQSIEQAKIYKARIEAEKKVLTEQLQALEADLKKLGVSPDTLDQRIKKLQEEYEQETKEIAGQLSQLPTEAFE